MARVQAAGQILDALPPAGREEALGGELGHLVGQHRLVPGEPVRPDAQAQFRLSEQLVALLAQAAAQRPLVLVLDDLQWADVASLEVLRHVAARLPPRTAVVCAMRNRSPSPGPELLRTLATVQRVPGHRRISLGPLDPAEVAELVCAETGHPWTTAAVEAIHARSSGNAFFVRELARSLTGTGEPDEGTVLRAGVPVTVRDVVGDRMTGLHTEVVALLRTAAVVGRDVELAVLARAADLDVETCLVRLEPLEAQGLLGPTPGDPYSYRFAHDLVRQTVTETTPPGRTGSLHLSVADALEQEVPGSESAPERVAHHLWTAGPLSDPARTVTALIRAGRLAVVKTALEAAEHQLRAAAQLARRSNLDGLELAALSELIGVTLMRSMYGTSSVDLLERAERLARSFGRDVEATVYLYSRWTAYAQAVDVEHSRPLARQLLDQGRASADPALRAYGHQAWGLQSFTDGDLNEGFRHLTEASHILIARANQPDDDPVAAGLGPFVFGMLAEATALQDDAHGARAVLSRLEGSDNPFAVLVWASHSARMEALLGEPERVLRAAERASAVDPDFLFAFMGTYARLARHWALAMLGEDPAAAAAEARRIIDANLVDPPRSDAATFYGLLAEMWLVAGESGQAAEALDRADECMELGQRYPEGLILLLRARTMLMSGEPVSAVRTMAGRSREVSVRRGTYSFARRARELLDTLDDRPDQA